MKAQLNASSRVKKPHTLDGAAGGLMCHLPGIMVARWRLVWLSMGGCWLPTWLPRCLLAPLMFDTPNV
jgi:hypothetical protein